MIELKLGPIKDGVLRIHFKGRLSSSYIGTATTIEVDGDCPLTPPKQPLD